MSRPAGTLITTHNANYISPRFMPGYRGHCPTTKFDYGETYGNATSKYFQDYRSEVLRSSSDPYCRGGQFPTYYTHNPDLVIGNRSRTQDKWTAAPKYQLSNIDHDRREELYKFDQLAQSHREHYTDKSGTRKSVDYFKLPVSAEEQFKKNAMFVQCHADCFLLTEHLEHFSMVLSTGHSDQISLPHLKHVARRGPLIRRVALNSSQRDREMRDVYFESR